MEQEVADPALFAFNGPYSLSVHYLVGLGLELILKAIIVARDPSMGEIELRRSIGHNLVAALDAVEAAGFESDAPYLRDVVETFNVPYQSHWLRYDRPDEFSLPGDFEQVLEMFNELDDELRPLFWD